MQFSYGSRKNTLIAIAKNKNLIEASSSTEVASLQSPVPIYAARRNFALLVFCLVLGGPVVSSLAVPEIPRLDQRCAATIPQFSEMQYQLMQKLCQEKKKPYPKILGSVSKDATNCGTVSHINSKRDEKMIANFNCNEYTRNKRRKRRMHMKMSLSVASRASDVCAHKISERVNL